MWWLKHRVALPESPALPLNFSFAGFCASLPPAAPTRLCALARLLSAGAYGQARGQAS